MLYTGSCNGVVPLSRGRKCLLPMHNIKHNIQLWLPLTWGHGLLLRWEFNMRASLLAVAFAFLMTAGVPKLCMAADAMAPDAEEFKGWPDVNIADLPKLMSEKDPFRRVLAVYLCKFDCDIPTLKIWLDCFRAESDECVRSLMLNQVSRFPASMMILYFDEDIVLEMVELLGPPDTLASPQAHAVLERVLSGHWPRTKRKFTDQWDNKKSDYLKKRAKACEACNVPPLRKPSEPAKEEADHDASGTVEGAGETPVEAHQDLKLPDPRKHTKDGVDFVFALDNSSSQKEHLEVLRRELAFLMRIALYFNEEDRVGFLTFCKDPEAYLPLTNNPDSLHAGAAALGTTHRGGETHDTPVYWALENFKWVNNKKIFLMITDENMNCAKDPKDLYTELFMRVSDGFEFDLLVPSNVENVKNQSKLGFDEYLEHGGGTFAVCQRRDPEAITVEIAKFFLRADCREAMTPFLEKLLELLRTQSAFSE